MTVAFEICEKALNSSCSTFQLDDSATSSANLSAMIKDCAEDVAVSILQHATYYVNSF